MSNRSNYDLLALLSMLLFVVGTGIGAMLLFAFTIWEHLFGPLDAPIAGTKAIVAVGSSLRVLAIGSAVGGALWILVAGRILPRPTVLKWLLYGPQVPSLTRLNLRLLALVSKPRSDVSPAA